MTSDDPLETLLDKLNQGDAAATEQVFRTYEPYLRKVVRRLLPASLRSRFDSVDVVQSVWTDLLERMRTAHWRFPDVAHLRAFLVRVARNRFLDRARQHQASIAREQVTSRAEPRAAAPTAPGPRPSEVAQAADLWARMLAACPPEHQQVLHLKRQGFSPEEIAAQTGMHPGSVRRLLRAVARRLALDTPGNDAAAKEIP
jgi:RNA polymerase sigma factor (sigma-70 family)